MLENQSRNALPAVHVIVEALWYCWRARRELSKVLFLPTIFMVALALATPWMHNTRSATVALLYSFSYLVVFSFAAVSCHRLILLGPRSVPPLGVTGKQRREWMFLIRAAALSIGTQIIYALLSNIAKRTTADFASGIAVAPTVINTLLWIAILILISPFSLALPARAIDAPITFRDAWRMARGHRWRLAFLIAGLPWLFQIAEWAIAKLFETNSDQLLVSVLLYLAILPFEIALLSVCYRRLRDDREESPSDITA